MVVGRAAEESELGRLVAGARSGSGGALVVAGEAGIGKTALIDRAARSADGMLVLRGAGYPSETGQRFASLDLLLRPIRDRTGELPGAQADALHAALAGGATDDGDRPLVRLAVLSLLCRLAAERPVLCLIENAQWLDPASADVLLFAARRVEADPIALVVAARDTGVFVSSGLSELWLHRLGSDAAAALLRSWGIPLSPPAKERIIEESEGNPLALRELAAALTPGQQSGLLNPFAFHERTHAVAGPVWEEFRERLDRLPASTRLLLLVVAAEDTRDLALVSVAAETLGAGPADLGYAERAGILQVSGTAVAFTHPLIRAVAYHHATTAVRRAAHRAIAEAAGEGQPELRAWQMAAATTGQREDLAAELERTAEWSGGLRMYAGYARAAELTLDRRTRAHRLAAAARAAVEVGLLDGAAELAAQAARLTEDPLTRAELAQISAAVECERGSPRLACRLLVDGAQLIAECDPVEAMLMLVEAIRSGCYAGDTGLLREVEASLGAVALPVGSPIASLPRAGRHRVAEGRSCRWARAGARAHRGRPALAPPRVETSAHGRFGRPRGGHRRRMRVRRRLRCGVPGERVDRAATARPASARPGAGDPRPAL